MCVVALLLDSMVCNEIGWWSFVVAMVFGSWVLFVFCCYEGRAVLNFFCVVGDMHGCECWVFCYGGNVSIEWMCLRVVVRLRGQSVNCRWECEGVVRR